MTKVIYTKTKDYIQALLEAQEVKDYAKAVEDFKKDSDAKKLLSDFQEAQQTHVVLRQGGFTGIEEQGHKVKFLQDKVSKNTKIHALVKTQQTLQNLVGDLTGEISQGINFPFTQPQSGGCCG